MESAGLLSEVLGRCHIGIWILQHSRNWCGSPAEVVAIRSEVLTTGVPGPGPRRLCRFVAGRVAHKGEYTPAKESELSELDEAIRLHFSERFQVTGVIQSFFQACDASKCMEDLFTARAKIYRPFVAKARGSDYVVNDLALCSEINSLPVLRRMGLPKIVSVLLRYPMDTRRLRQLLPPRLCLPAYSR